MNEPSPVERHYETLVEARGLLRHGADQMFVRDELLPREREWREGAVLRRTRRLEGCRP